MEKHEGAFILWKWGDQEIDDLKLLRQQLLDISLKGFSGIIVSLGLTRYEFINHKVLRAVAQVSQWANKRKIAFWFETDPRQSSRSFISKTEERTQYLIAAKRMNDGLSQKHPFIAKVEKNRFELRFEYSQTIHSAILQERALHLEPVNLEKAFIFQKENGVVLRDSVRDITSASHFFANVEESYVDVFGDIHIPENEEWWVIAFPKFNTNVYDYAGFQSNNLLCLFIEDLFDTCTHLDGTAWGEGRAGYIVDMGCFPVSLSIYNGFHAECGYDLRNVLYGLVLNVDDESHVRIRLDYYSLLMNTVFGAQKEFYQTVHSFLGNVDIGIHHHFQSAANQVSNLVRGTVDPWKSLESVGSPIIEIEHIEDLKRNSQTVIPVTTIAKSLGVYSNTQRVFCGAEYADHINEELNYFIDLLALYSINLLLRIGEKNLVSHINEPIKNNCLNHINWDNITKINDRINLIRNITEFKFPEANVALIFPIETIIAMGSQDAEEIVSSVNQIITRLVMTGIQIDVIAPSLIKECHLFPDGLSIRSRIYESVIFPYPEVVDPDVLDIISSIMKSNLPFFFGGCKPRYTTSGKKIPHIFPLTFDPQNIDFSFLKNKGIKQLFTLPENGLGTMIYQGEDILFLICPKQYGQSVKGEVQYQKISFSIPKSSSLVIFRKRKYKKVEQLL